MKIPTGKYTRSAGHEEIRAALGLAPKAKLPKESIDPVNIDGWVVWVEKVRPCTRQGKPHRALAQCPKCFKVISAGRIWQHAKAHKETV